MLTFRLVSRFSRLLDICRSVAMCLRIIRACLFVKHSGCSTLRHQPAVLRAETALRALLRLTEFRRPRSCVSRMCVRRMSA